MLGGSPGQEAQPRKLLQTTLLNRNSKRKIVRRDRRLRGKPSRGRRERVFGNVGGTVVRHKNPVVITANRDRDRRRTSADRRRIAQAAASRADAIAGKRVRQLIQNIDEVAQWIDSDRIGPVARSKRRSR